MVIKITWKVSKRKRISGIWRQHLPMQRNLGCHIGIVVKSRDAINKSAVATNEQKNDNVLHMRPKFVSM